MQQSPTFEIVHKMLEDNAMQQAGIDNSPEEKNQLKILPWNEFDAIEFPPQRWIIQDLLPAGASVLIAAPSGEKKSWIGMAMAVALGSGTPFLNHDEFPTVQCNVLYIEQETPQHEVQRRGRQLGFNKASDKIWFLGCDELSLNDSAYVQQIHQFIEAHDIQVIFIDTFRSVAGGLHEEKAEEVRMFFQRFKAWKDQGKTIIFLDHCRKPQKFEKGSVPKKEQVLGSQDKVASVEVLIMLKSPQESDEIALHVVKSKMAREHRPIRIMIKDSEIDGIVSTLLTYAGAIEEQQLKKDEAKECILAYLQGEGEKQESKDIINALDGTCGKTAIENALKELRQENEIGWTQQKRKYLYWHKEAMTEEPIEEEIEPNSLFNDPAS